MSSMSSCCCCCCCRLNISPNGLALMAEQTAETANKLWPCATGQLLRIKDAAQRQRHLRFPIHLLYVLNICCLLMVLCFIFVCFVFFPHNQSSGLRWAFYLPTHCIRFAYAAAVYAYAGHICIDGPTLGLCDAYAAAICLHRTCLPTVPTQAYAILCTPEKMPTRALVKT